MKRLSSGEVTALEASVGLAAFGMELSLHITVGVLVVAKVLTAGETGSLPLFPSMTVSVT